MIACCPMFSFAINPGLLASSFLAPAQPPKLMIGHIPAYNMMFVYDAAPVTDRRCRRMWFHVIAVNSLHILCMSIAAPYWSVSHSSIRVHCVIIHSSEWWLFWLNPNFWERSSLPLCLWMNLYVLRKRHKNQNITVTKRYDISQSLLLPLSLDMSLYELTWAMHKRNMLATWLVSENKNISHCWL